MTAPIAAAWRYRQFICTSIKSELANRFARSRLGAAWFILHPLAYAAIFATVLSEVLGARLPGVKGDAAYAIYLLSGLAAWQLFSDILLRSVTLFIDNASSLKKLAFPRICLPLVVWGSTLVNHLLLLVAIAVVSIMFGHYPSPAWLALPLGMVLISMFAFGLGVMAGIFNVFARDVGQIFGVVLQLWFWLTPIVYPVDSIPARLRWLVDLNPMTAVVRIYQDALLLHDWPHPLHLMIPAFLATALVVLTCMMFRRAGSDLVDAL